MASDGRDYVSNGSVWLRRKHLPSVVEAPESVPSMTNKKQKERQKTSREKMCFVEEVALF